MVGGRRPGLQMYYCLCLLDAAANLGEYVVGIRPDEPDGAHDNHQDYGQHNGVFGDVLSSVIGPSMGFG